MAQVKVDGRDAAWWKEKLMQVISGFAAAEGVVHEDSWQMDVAHRKFILEEFAKWCDKNEI